jgi:hypothetical protein
MKKNVVWILAGLFYVATVLLLVAASINLSRQVNQLKATVKQQDEFIAQQKVFNNILKGVIISIADTVDQVQGDVEALKNPKGTAQ